MIGEAGSAGAILYHLKQKGEITQNEATALYGCTRLAARIYDFRKSGYIIDTIMEEHTNRYGIKGKHARYVLAKEQSYGKSRSKVSSKNV